MLIVDTWISDSRPTGFAAEWTITSSQFSFHAPDHSERGLKLGGMGGEGGGGRRRRGIRGRERLKRGDGNYTTSFGAMKKPSMKIT